jgi:hypothetical protein
MISKRFAQASRDFAARNGRIENVEGRHLKLA